MKAGSLQDDRLFTGTLAIGDQQTAISFHARVTTTGDVQLELDQLPLTNETKFIMLAGHDDKNIFRLEGTSEDGASFQSKHLYFSSLGRKFDERGSHYEFRPSCAAATFRSSTTEPDDRPVLIRWLKRFECFDVNPVKSAIGDVRIAGPSMLGDNADLVTGVLLVKADAVPHDVQAWRDEAGKLLDHVRRVMAFAAGIEIGSPATEFRHGSQVEVEIRSSVDSPHGHPPSFHVLEREGIFEAAVRSFDKLPIDVKNLDMALEWLVMPATYNEVRLVNAMTALENIVSSNIGDAGKLLDDATFAKLRKAIRATTKEFVEGRKLDDDQPELVAELNEKLADLQRRSLKRKLYLLVDRWSVPMHGLDDGMIPAAITARNHIVHEGRYYVAGTKQTELWEHVTVVREVITRIVLTALGYQGGYISHVGGYHHAAFPPVSSS